MSNWKQKKIFLSKNNYFKEKISIFRKNQYLGLGLKMSKKKKTFIIYNVLCMVTITNKNSNLSKHVESQVIEFNTVIEVKKSVPVV